MSTAYFDAFSGLSGDMVAGALIDCGADFGELERAAASLGMGGYRLAIRRKDLSGIAATKFEVEVFERQPERHFAEIRQMIERAELAPRVSATAVAIFEALAIAEAKVHRTTPDEVHFHEVGAVDSIIDIVTAAWGLDQLGLDTLLVSRLPMGSGFTRSQHGIIPVPAPATAELLAGFPVNLCDGAAEMVTPTGAAIVKALARPAPIPLTFAIERIGYGAGTRTLDDRPNVLRLLIGNTAGGFASDELIEIAANIDDLNPQIYDHLSGRLFAAGARDVSFTPIVMKKGRPAIMLTVLAEAASRERVADMIFRETSTIGLRFHPVGRLKLERKTFEVATRFGPIRVKVSGMEGDALTLSPEYDDCHRAALAADAPLKIVMEEAQAAARTTLG
ncbi:MAG TPA: nickel pincer cofactor biosynthesis protein LarC [Candidatus Binataceae bacterium]|nr:nickel pincer cofactor biosynthesis protein LarC [Candidatus Binataceae bacterium]